MIEPTESDLDAIERPRFDDLEAITVEIDQDGGVIRVLSVKAKKLPIEHAITADDWRSLDDGDHRSRVAGDWQGVRRRASTYDAYEDRRRPAEAA